MMQEFEKIPQIIESQPETVDPALVEKQKEIFEEAKDKRGGFLENIIQTRTTETILNLVPAVGQLKMVTESILGKSLLQRRELTARERFDYIAVSGAFALAATLAIAGMPTEALTAKGIGIIIGSFELTPGEFKELAERNQERFPKISNILSKTADFLNDKREMVARLARGYKDSLINPPEAALDF